MWWFAATIALCQLVQTVLMLPVYLGVKSRLETSGSEQEDS